MLGPFDAGQLVFPCRGGNLDPKVDALQAAVLEAVTAGECEGRSRAEIFDAVRRLAGLGSRHDCTDPARRPAAYCTCSNPGSARRTAGPAARCPSGGADPKASSISNAVRAVISLSTVL